LFTNFIDYPMLSSGRDASWSVGTEFRQLRIYDEELSSPSNMRKMMVDNVARRHYIIDADVKVIFWRYDNRQNDTQLTDTQ